MAVKSERVPSTPLRRRYEEALVASGLVDHVADLPGLDPKPRRYLEGDYICRCGDPAQSLWIIVSGSVAVREENRTLFVRGPNEVVGEQNLLGNGFCRRYDLIANESQVELLEIDQASLEAHPQVIDIWRNIAKIISLKLKDSSIKTSALSRQLEDDTRILKAYMSDYALSRRLQSGRGRVVDHNVDRAIIWFSDVVDFSRYVLQLPPVRTAEIVQRFFNAQTSPIAAHGGHVDKFIGDGLMAFWVLSGAESAADQCLEAFRAAEEAVEAVARISIGKQPLGLRIGLHIGLVLSGDFGSVARHQFTLIGPEVNKAARLEQVHAADIIDGERDVGPIRVSLEFRNELAEPIRARIKRFSRALAKNIGEIEFYS